MGARGRTRGIAASAICALALGLVGCGGGDGSAETAAGTLPADTAPAPPAPPAEPEVAPGDDLDRALENDHLRFAAFDFLQANGWTPRRPELPELLMFGPDENCMLGSIYVDFIEDPSALPASTDRVAVTVIGDAACREAMRRTISRFDVEAALARLDD